MKTFITLFLAIFIFVGNVFGAVKPGLNGDAIEGGLWSDRWDEHGTNDDGTWWGITNGVRYEGVSVCSSQEATENYEMLDEISLDYGSNCWCKITSPFDGKYVFFTNMLHHNSGDLCDLNCKCGEEIMYYDDILSYSNVMIKNLHNALLNSQKKKAAACYLKTSTGVSLPLYDVKSTSPALHVLRDGVIYYGNMELGQGTNTLNVDYNGVIYHLVE